MIGLELLSLRQELRGFGHPPLPHPDHRPRERDFAFVRGDRRRAIECLLGLFPSACPCRNAPAQEPGVHISRDHRDETIRKLARSREVADRER